MREREYDWIIVYIILSVGLLPILAYCALMEYLAKKKEVVNKR